MKTVLLSFLSFTTMLPALFAQSDAVKQVKEERERTAEWSLERSTWAKLKPLTPEAKLLSSYNCHLVSSDAGRMQIKEAGTVNFGAMMNDLPQHHTQTRTSGSSVGTPIQFDVTLSSGWFVASFASLKFEIAAYDSEAEEIQARLIVDEHEFGLTGNTESTSDRYLRGKPRSIDLGTLKLGRKNSIDVFIDHYIPSGESRDLVHTFWCESLRAPLEFDFQIGRD